MRTSTVIFLICLLALPIFAVKNNRRSKEDLLNLQDFHSIVHEKDFEGFHSALEHLGEELSELSQNEAEETVGHILEALGSDISENYSDEDYQNLNELAHGFNEQVLSDRREDVDDVYRHFDFAFKHLQALYQAVRPAGVHCPLEGLVPLPICPPPQEEASASNSSQSQNGNANPPSWIQLKSRLNPEEFKSLVLENNVDNLYEKIKEALESLAELTVEEAGTNFQNFVLGVATSAQNYNDEEYLLLGNSLQKLAHRLYNERREHLAHIKYEYKPALDFINHAYDALKPENLEYSLPRDNQTEHRIEEGNCKHGEPQDAASAAAQVLVQIKSKARKAFKHPGGPGSGSGGGNPGNGGPGNSGSGNGGSGSVNGGSGSVNGGSGSVDGGSGSGNSGSGNSGSGNSGNNAAGNTGSGNNAAGNTGSGNNTAGNTGSGNNASGNTGSGNNAAGNTDSGNNAAGNSGSGDNTSGNSGNNNGQNNNGQNNNGQNNNGQNNNGQNNNGDNNGQNNSGNSEEGVLEGDNENSDFVPITDCFVREAPAPASGDAVLVKLRKHRRLARKHNLRSLKK